MNLPADILPDDEPLVVLDSAADVEALPVQSAQGSTAAAMRWLVMHSQQELSRCTAMQAFLQDLGCPNPTLWSSYRLGTGGPSLTKLSDVNRTALEPTGLIHPLYRTLTIARSTAITIPTYDPAQPDQPIGIIRLAPAQLKSAWSGVPAGIACTPSISDAQRIILVDIPALALRLAQLGVPGVAIVGLPEVLTPMIDWLRPRSLVLVSYRQQRLEAMRAALGPIGDSATPLILKPVIADSPRAALTCLGLDHAALTVNAAPQPPVTPLILTEIAEYAQARIAAGEGAEALAEHQADQTDLVAAYRLGYLPPDFRTCLSRSTRQALTGISLGGGLIAPALDEQGAVVDLVVLQDHNHRSTHSIWDEPRGLLAPEILHRGEPLIITDTFRSLSQLFQQGHRSVLFLRGAADAQHNAVRIAAAGIQRVQLRCRAPNELMGPLQAAGITVTRVRSGSAPVRTTARRTRSVPIVPTTPAGTPTGAEPAAPANAVASVHAVPLPAPATAPNPAPAQISIEAADALTFIEEDRAAGILLFQAGSLRIAVERRRDGISTREVVVRAPGKIARDRIDLASDAQRQRFADNAARSLGIPSLRILAPLASLWPAVQGQETHHAHTPVTVAPAECAAAEAFLAAPDLTVRIQADLAAGGWIGEPDTALLCYLVALSRLLPEPVWAVYRTGGAPCGAGISLIAALTAPEDLARSPLTAAGLNRVDHAALRHRLQVIEDAHLLRPDAVLALRILHQRGGVDAETRGPVAVLAAASGDLDAHLRDRFLTIASDDSPAQTARIQDHQRWSRMGGISSEPIGDVAARHHALQRVLERRPVVIPFTVPFPIMRLQHRALFAQVLSLIQASAILHQRQRQRSGDAILADTADEALIHRLCAPIVAAATGGLSRQAQLILDAIQASHLEQVAVADLRLRLPECSRHDFRTGLQELVEFGFLVHSLSLRGQTRRYRLAAAPTNEKWATLAMPESPTSQHSTPVTATG